jgi:hypothetical protein
MFLEHLVTASAADFVPDILPDKTPFTELNTTTPAQTLSSQLKTSEWLQAFDDDDEAVLNKTQEEKVADTFNALTRADPNAKQRLLELDLTEEIKAAIGMVTAYQWKFVEQAENLRSLAVSKIVKEIEHPDARIRLKALEMLGKVTEVALFTDRVHVKTEEISDEELDKQIKDKLERYMGAVDVVDADVKDVE